MSRLIPANQIHFTVHVPRPKGARGVAVHRLPVSPSGDDARLTMVSGVLVNAPDVETNTRTGLSPALAGWRLYVDVDGAMLIDGAPLTKVRAFTWLRLRPAREAGEQVLVLTPRDPAYVEVAVGVEWRGKGKPRRLPPGVTVTVCGVD